MEKAGITMNRFIAGLVIAILASSVLSVGISTLLIKGSQGPQGPQGETGATGAQGPYLPDYDSGWIDISNKTGMYFNVTHNLNGEDTIVDIRGKTTATGEANQKYFGLISKTQWAKTYGGTNLDIANAVVHTRDGGYALAGYTYSYGADGSDFWLVKTDASGNTLWTKTYGGTNDDIACSAVQTGDGGYAIAGYTTSFGTGTDFWLVKTDSSGNLQRNQTYGGPGIDVARSVIQTGDGGYTLAGRTNSSGAGNFDFWLVKTDSSGNQQWNQTYGGAGYDEARSVVQTSDGGYAIAGYTNSYSVVLDYDFWLVKTNASGDTLWTKTYGRTSDDFAYSVVQTDDGGFAIAGYTNSYGVGGFDFWLVKTDSSGNALWAKTYGGTGDDHANSVVQTDDGGYGLAGDTNSYGAGGFDFWLVKTDSSGNQQWTKTYGGTADDVANSVVQTDDGGYVLAGLTYSFGADSSDFWLVKTEVESGLAWTDSAANTITLYRGATDNNWNYVRVRIWKIH